MSAPISIHALRVEGDSGPLYHAARRLDFYPRPPSGGRQYLFYIQEDFSIFLSTPSEWRATFWRGYRYDTTTDFYPRPPGGGRLITPCKLASSTVFLSTPSGWRATTPVSGQCNKIKFLSTPSGWRATAAEPAPMFKLNDISIHALRVEGDSKNGQSFRLFLRKREKNLPL